MGFGVKVQEAPLGKPLQAKVTVPANEFTELTVNWVIPTVPGATESVESDRLKLMFGVTPVELTMKLCETNAAAAKALFPPWDAVMVHVPAAMNVAVAPVAPESVQTLVVRVVKLTGRLEVAVAESDNVVPSTWVPGFGKEMVCVGRAARTETLC
jgi:hypothetical protein